MHIYNLKTNKMVKTMEYKRSLETFQFTYDIIILFSGDLKGFVFGNFIQHGFKRFYK